MAKLASRVVRQAQKWVGCREADGSHKEIIDTYNAYKPLARGYKVKYTDAWCAAFVSACAIKAGCTDILPTECGCNQMIELFKKLGKWIEDDEYVPKPGDVLFYDWQDSGIGENRGSSEHVGIVERVEGLTAVIIEGNKDNAVDRRLVEVNGRYIRGYGIPEYDEETTELTTVNDITWELNHTYFPITETSNFINALEEAKQLNSPLYWGYYKLVNKITE